MTAPKSKCNGESLAVKPVEPINLRECVGGKYKIAYDEAFAAEHGPNARVDDPWLQLVPGRLGHVFPYGGELLGVSTNSRGPVANHLTALPCCEVVQDGDDGITVKFHVDHLQQVARIIHARTTRTLTAAQRKALIDAGGTHRFNNGHTPPRGRVPPG